MTFAMPWMLLGLLTVAVPIVVHLIHRKRAVRRVFPAMTLLLQSNRRLARGLRLKRVLLLALRIALFVLVPLAMARPGCGGDGAATGGQDDRLPASVVVIVDQSASMSQPVPGHPTAHAGAIDVALATIADLRPWDRVAVVGAGDRVLRASGVPAEDHAAARRALERIPLGSGGSRLDDALRVARELHDTNDLPARRTLVLTDGAAHAWPAPPLGEAVDPAAVEGIGRLEIRTLTSGATGNTAVREVRWNLTADGVQVEADLTGPPDATLDVAVWLDDARSLTRAVAVSDDGSALASFLLPTPNAGVHDLRVTVDDGVGPAHDDVRGAVLSLDREARILLVNGDPRAVQFNDELFFAQHALDAAIVDGAPFVTRSVPVERFTPQVLTDTDVVVLANVATLPVERAAALAAWVESGGGLLMTVGSNVQVETWNQTFGAVLPRPLRDLRELSRADAPDVGVRAARLGLPDATHPIFRVFAAPGGETLQSVMAWQYALLEATTEDTARIVLAWQDGAPALVERAVGQGRVLLWTTSIDDGWSDVPLRTAYVPLLRRMLEYLARRGHSATADVTVGAPLPFDLAALSVSAIVVTPPSGPAVRLTVEDEPTFVPTEAGLHRVSGEQGGAVVALPALAFWAHPPDSEQQQEALPASRITSLQQAAVRGTGVADAEAQRERSLWPALLLAALIALYAESLLAIRRKVWRGFRRG